MDFESEVTRGLDGNYNRGEDRFQQELRLRPMKYGFFRVGQVRQPLVCNFCTKEINGEAVKINNKVYHARECYTNATNS